MSNESRKPEGGADQAPETNVRSDEPMSDERREALRKVLLTAAYSAPVVTSLLAPRDTKAQFSPPPDP